MANTRRRVRQRDNDMLTASSSSSSSNQPSPVPPPLTASQSPSAPTSVLADQPPQVTIPTGAVSHRGGRVAGSKNYTPEQVDHLLTLVQGQLPIGNWAWEELAKSYNRAFPSHPRDGETLKLKYHRVRDKLTPTGNPHPNAHTLRAIKIDKLITEKEAQYVVGGIPPGGDVDNDSDNDDDNYTGLAFAAPEQQQTSSGTHAAVNRVGRSSSGGGCTGKRTCIVTSTAITLNVIIFVIKFPGVISV